MSVAFLQLASLLIHYFVKRSYGHPGTVLVSIIDRIIVQSCFSLKRKNIIGYGITINEY